jgi:2-polyprenyl-3-methyl-5-hydroxy-6-metoxy-1,4-benzoquinol methylase
LISPAALLKSAVGNTIVVIGTFVGRVGSWILLHLHAFERVVEPVPLTIGDRTFDTVDDLVVFTGLPRDTIIKLLHRKIDSYRVEWHLFPRQVRTDDWFYRSSRTYLFANAVHTGDLANELFAFTPTGSHVLDFGGGTGGLALGLAALGAKVDYYEVSAVQKDFMRFRIDRYGLADRITVVNDWASLTHERYDVLYAFDVFEHLPELEATLRDKLLPSLKPAAQIVESSPFIRNFANPMHFEDATQLDSTLVLAGFREESRTAKYRLWRR